MNTLQKSVFHSAYLGQQLTNNAEQEHHEVEPELREVHQEGAGFTQQRRRLGLGDLQLRVRSLAARGTRDKATVGLDIHTLPT